MELRSRRSVTRSRSKTPFTQIYSSETVEGGGHVEETVTRTTRRTTTVYKTNDNTISSSEEYLNSQDSKPITRSKTANSVSGSLIRGIGYKTSDYSSEEGESEVSSSRIISQNDRNQLIEDAKRAANGSHEVSALDLYRKAGRYWDKYPKTDWTYSPHSRDRVELAPGVVQMPNMSRRTIHSYCSGDYSSKETNTEHYMDEVDYTAHRRSADGYFAKMMPQKLFANNNYKDSYSSRSRYSYSRSSYFSRIASVLVTIITTILTPLYYVYSGFNSVMMWIGRKLHRVTSKVMLFDTWLLRSTTNSQNKVKRVLLLILVPLLLFGGLWLISALGGSLYDAMSNISQAALDSSVRFDNYLFGKAEHSETIKPQLPPSAYIHSEEDEVSRRTRNIEVERIIVEPPSAAEIAARLTPEQINKIAMTVGDYVGSNVNVNIDEIVQRVLLTPEIKNIINNYNYIDVGSGRGGDKVDADVVYQQQQVINNLRAEMEQIREELLEMKKVRTQDMHNIDVQFAAEGFKHTRLMLEINKCCRRNIINIEGYVSQIVADLLSDPNFVKARMSNWLHTMFVAKQDLERHIDNATKNLDARFDSLIQDNGKLLMDQVNAKIRSEITEQVRKSTTTSTTHHHSDISLGSVTDDHIRSIVRSTLAVYDADKTGLVDYAMEPMGGQVLTTRCTESYHAGTAVVSVLGIPLWYPTNSPRTVITPGLNPGECWAFQNFPGFLVIKLASLVKVEAFSLEHISRLLVPDGKIDSAPKEFEVYGLRAENDKEPVLLGRYVYDYDGESLQYFAAQNDSLVFDTIELRIISNHGNPNYTCLYRFRVHGKLVHDAT